MKRNLERIMGGCLLGLVLLASVYFNFESASVQAAKIAENEKQSEAAKKESTIKKGEFTVVVDAGHGGFDPGKVGINDELEKNINLSIALKVKEKLEEQNVTVVMTREEDIALCEENASGKKSSDMQNRINIVNEANADACISIHQNSYTSKEVKGAQVFYYSKSEQGKKLAEMIQASLKETLADGNKRVEKSNDKYYMLLKAECTSVIVECGFLSNWEDATNLKDDFYQEKVADAICGAVVSFLLNI